MSTPSWIGSLSTSSIATDMAAAVVNGAVSYAGLEKVFADLAAKLTSTGTTLTQAQLTDLQTIAANLNNGLSTSSYLTYVTKALVNGNAANAKWTGGAASSTTLGNLAVGASGAQLAKLTGKWFLGSDLPTSSVTMDGSSFSVSYSASSKPLFASGGPSMNDINQGYLGDCYLLSGLAEVALQNSSLITSMFTSNGNGTYGVRFYVNGQAEYVTVDASLANGGNIFNYGGSDIWASLAEKAYAELQASGVVTGNSINYGNSFSTIGNGGAPEYALEEITGASAITDFVASGGTWTRVVYNASFQVTGYSTSFSTATVCTILCGDLAQGNDLILSSYTDAVDSAGKTTLVSDHAMSIIGYDSATGNFVIRNPWGSASGQYWDTTFEVSLATLLADGDTITADNVAPATTATSLPNPGTTWHVIDAGDFNGDRRADILWQNNDGTPSMWMMNGSSISAWGSPLPDPGPTWHVIGAADFNGDGRADILWQNNDGTPSMWMMNGSSISAWGSPLPDPGPTWHVIGAADFNGDGKADILWQNDNGTPSIWMMNGSSISGWGSPLPNPGPTWHVMGAADFNGDGKADILWQNDDGTPSIWMMNGSSISGWGSPLPNPGPTWHVVGAGDFNGDGKADILWQNNDGTPSIWMMNGSSISAWGSPLPNPGTSSHVIGAGDFNGDGKADILWQDSNGTPSMWLMNGSTITG